MRSHKDQTSKQATCEAHGHWHEGHQYQKIKEPSCAVFMFSSGHRFFYFIFSPWTTTRMFSRQIIHSLCDGWYKSKQKQQTTKRVLLYSSITSWDSALEKILTNLEELSFLTVLAFPKAGKREEQLRPNLPVKNKNECNNIYDFLYNLKKS